GDAARATLVLQNGTMDLVSFGPVDFSSNEVLRRYHFTYAIAGTLLSVSQTCPSPNAMASIPYTAQGDTLILDFLPGIFGTPTFTRQHKRQMDGSAAERAASGLCHAVHAIARAAATEAPRGARAYCLSARSYR